MKEMRRARMPWVRRSALGVLTAAGLLAGLAVPATAYPRPGVTERVSVASDGTEANGLSFASAISADGRYVAFHSFASNLVPGDTNSKVDVFVRDRVGGVTERVSVASDGTEANGSSGPLGDVVSPPGGLAISADARYVAFLSAASNLVPGDTNSHLDVFVRDRVAGVTERVSVASDGTEASSPSSSPTISADGRYVAFLSYASNLVPGDTNSQTDVFVRDRVAGVTERVSVDAGEDMPGTKSVSGASISADGRYVAFLRVNQTMGTISPFNMGYTVVEVFVHDRATGTTERVSATTEKTSQIPYWRASISADGRYVAFPSSDPTLVPGDTGVPGSPPVTVTGDTTMDVFVHDRKTKATERVSISSAGAAEGNRSPGPSGKRHDVSISADGRYVAFIASSPFGIFVHDRATGTTEQVSVATDGAAGNGFYSQTPTLTLSADGRYVAFTDIANNLVPGDDTGTFDVFVRDRGPATGVGGLSVIKGSGQLGVSGWATFSGVPIGSAEDPESDSGVARRELGAEIVGGSIIYRPEAEDLLLRLRLASLPGPVVGAAPGVLYRWRLTAGDTEYEVRAMRAAATAVPPAAPHFALYKCASSACGEPTPLSGGIGTAGPEVRVAVPLWAVGASAGTSLSAIQASTALGEAATGTLAALDDVSLPDATIPVSRVDLGIAPASTSEAQVAYTTRAGLRDGRFSATLPVSSLPAGNYRVWAKACLGDVCGTHSSTVRL